jgi:Domain of unknown function (DUF4340)
MRGKTLTILLITLAVVAGAGVLLLRSKSSAPPDESIGAPLFQNLPVNDIAAIQMKSAQASAALARKDDRWVVEDRHDYPADFSRLTEMIRQLKALKVGRRFEAAEEILKRLGLMDPADPSAGEEEKAFRVLLKDKDGTVLADIRLGKPRISEDERQFPDGQYVRIGEDPTVFLVDRALSAYSAEPTSWLDRKLTEVQAAEVKKISCTDTRGKVLYAFERSESEEDLSPLVKIPKGRDLDKGSLNRVAGGLSSLRLEDVAQEGQGFDEKAALVLEYQLFNGMIYRVYPDAACQNDKRCPIRIRVDFQAPSQSTGAQAASGPPAEKSPATPEPSPDEMASRAKSLDSRFTPWVFHVPTWQHGNLLTSLEQLLQKPEEKTRKKDSDQ